MLTKEQVENNKQEFISIIKSINRPGANIDGLIKKLENSDFFYAPASTVYHCSYEGGLCEHSLHVYKHLVKLANLYCPTQLSDSTGISYMSEDTKITLDSESLKIVGLLHDFSKMGFYESYLANRKIYSNDGRNQDAQGNYDWVSVQSYRVKNASERFIFGTHGQNSEYMTGSYIPLKVEESAAIIWHMGGMDEQNKSADVSIVYNRYPLAMLLHLADMTSSYIDERL